MVSHTSEEFVRADEKKGSVGHSNDGVQVPIYNDVEAASSEDLSIGAILRGTATKPMNTFEKKAALINVELDKFGLGKYQLCIWFLCGFGYFLDLAWSQVRNDCSQIGALTNCYRVLVSHLRLSTRR